MCACSSPKAGRIFLNSRQNDNMSRVLGQAYLLWPRAIKVFPVKKRPILEDLYDDRATGL